MNWKVTSRHVSSTSVLHWSPFIHSTSIAPFTPGIQGISKNGRKYPDSELCTMLSSCRPRRFQTQRLASSRPWKQGEIHAVAAYSGRVTFTPLHPRRVIISCKVEANIRDLRSTGFVSIIIDYIPRDTIAKLYSSRERFVNSLCGIHVTQATHQCARGIHAQLG